MTKKAVSTTNSASASASNEQENNTRSTATATATTTNSINGLFTLQLLAASMLGRSTKDFDTAYPATSERIWARISNRGYAVGMNISNLDAIPQPTLLRLLQLGFQRHMSVACLPELGADETGKGQVEEILDELAAGYGTLEKAKGVHAPRESILTDEQLQSKALWMMVNATRKAKGANVYSVSDWAKVWRDMDPATKAAKMAIPAVQARFQQLEIANNLKKQQQQAAPEVDAELDM
jgi:hypothetical protein